jgi:hypothetical protein
MCFHFQSLPTVRKTPHTAYKGGSPELSHAQNFNKQGGWPREKAQQLLSAGLVLIAFGRKQGQRMVFDLQRKRPAAGARSQAKGGGER